MLLARLLFHSLVTRKPNMKYDIAIVLITHVYSMVSYLSYCILELLLVLPLAPSLLVNM